MQPSEGSPQVEKHLRQDGGGLTGDLVNRLFGLRVTAGDRFRGRNRFLRYSKQDSEEMKDKKGSIIVWVIYTSILIHYYCSVTYKICIFMKN